MKPFSSTIIGKNEQGGDFVQVYNLDTKQKLGVWTCPEDLVLMSWLNENQLGMVLTKSTYHWRVEGGEPEKIMDRTGTRLSTSAGSSD